METTRGVYVGLRVIGGANRYLDAYIAANNIPVVQTPKERRRHTTVIYSRVHAPIEAQQGRLHQAYGKAFKVFDEPDGRRCLVLVLNAPTVEERHADLMKRYPQLTYDFPSYIPHITLSYDIGDYDEQKLALPAFCCVLSDEYVEDLKLDWKKDE